MFPPFPCSKPTLNEWRNTATAKKASVIPKLLLAPHSLLQISNFVVDSSTRFFLFFSLSSVLDSIRFDSSLQFEDLISAKPLIFSVSFARSLAEPGVEKDFRNQLI